MSETTQNAGTAAVEATQIRVLHVDDDPEFATLVAEFLARENERIDVVTESHPEDALRRLEDGGVHCVVTDYQMPDMDGVELIRSIRERDADLPCIIYTGQGSEEVASEAISAGATDYLQKGTGNEQYELLANRIENAVESYRAERRAGTLERTRAVARKVNQALVRTSNRDEMEARICDILANAEGYQGVWISAVDETGTLEPRTTAGIDESSFVDRSPAGSDGGPFPAETAVREGEFTVVDDVTEDVANDRLRDLALEHGIHSIAAVPLAYDDELYGVLVVGSDRAGTFNTAERDLLVELGDDVAYAINAVRMRTALQEERDRRAALFENAPNPIVEFEAGDPTTVADVNAAFEETFGFTAEEMRRRPFTDVLVPPEDRERHESLLDSAAAGEQIETEVRRQTADGVRDFLLTVSPSGEDDRGGTYAWYIDITDRKSLASELQEQANLLDHIFGQIPTALYVKDTEARHVRMSDYDVPPEEVMGKTDPEIYGESEFTRETYEDDMRVIENGERMINQEEYNPENGEWTLTSKVPWYGDDGEVKGLIGVSRLITEKKVYEREIERKNARLEDFANVVSHDLRNPLNVAAGQVDIVRDEVDDERLDRASDALDRMDALIGDILTLAQQGWSVEETSSVALSAVFDRAWESVDTASATKRVEPDCRFRANDARLLQLLDNLVRNAVEHSATSHRSSPTHEDTAGAGSDVTVRAGGLEEGFFVEDDGPGIPPEDRENVFEPGFTTSRDGTGFGLAIVTDIVEAHGWDISVTESEAGGARFEITGVEMAE